MHTVLIGIQSDNIKSDVQPYLLQATTSDEVLLEKVNIACANEKEGQEKKKHAVPLRVTSVNTVQSSYTTGPTEKKIQFQNKAESLLCHLNYYQK